MKSAATFFYRSILILAAIVLFMGCASTSPGQDSQGQTKLAKQMEELQQLKSAEYQDFTIAMDSEESNRKLGNYYVAKGSEVHDLIERMEKGRPVSDVQISRALDDSAADQLYDVPASPMDF